MKRAWLLDELKLYPVARKALGVILSRAKEDPLKQYSTLYRGEVLAILENALKDREDYLEEVDTYLYAKARLEYMLPAKPKANDILAAMEVVDGWQSPRLALILCLQKRGNLQTVKDALGLDCEDPSPASDREFLEELKNLSLGEFLELVTR